MPRVKKDRLFKNCFPPNVKLGQTLWVRGIGIEGVSTSTWRECTVFKVGVENGKPFGSVRFPSGLIWFFDNSTWGASNRYAEISLFKPIEMRK